MFWVDRKAFVQEFDDACLGHEVIYIVCDLMSRLFAIEWYDPQTR